MKALTALLIIFSSVAGTMAQPGLDFILTEVEKNNTSLMAFRDQAASIKYGNKTGIYLQNPEVDFGYLFGNPSGIGNRTDISITQSFYFPTVYSYKRQIANKENETIEFEYLKQLQMLKLRVKMLYIDLVYSNALISEYKKRVENASAIAEMYRQKSIAGETSILDYNKSKMNLLNQQKDLESIVLTRKSYIDELVLLNGGKSVDILDSVFITPQIPSDFESWFIEAQQKAPILQIYRKEIEISKQQECLSTALTLPKFQTGYLSESVPGQKFQGVSFGLSIPLWENKNTVKYAKARTVALQSYEIDAKNTVYNQLKAYYSKALSLKSNHDEYRMSMEELNNAALLKKALDKGELSLLEYILELSFYYQSVDRLLTIERDLNKAITELYQF